MKWFLCLEGLGKVHELMYAGWGNNFTSILIANIHKRDSRHLLFVCQSPLHQIMSFGLKESLLFLFLRFAPLTETVPDVHIYWSTNNNVHIKSSFPSYIGNFVFRETRLRCIISLWPAVCPMPMCTVVLVCVHGIVCKSRGAVKYTRQLWMLIAGLF